MLVLVVNCGSSSLKYELFRGDESLASGLADRVGVNGGSQALLTHSTTDGKQTIEATMPDHTVAFGYVVQALTHPQDGVLSSLHEIDAVGHRVVHGGEQFTEAVLIDGRVLAAIEQYCKLAPLHNPPNLEGIRACQQHLPGTPMVAVFDTAFHQTMPDYAYVYALPYELYEQQRIRRYGFHGTSHRYVALEASHYLEAQGIPLAEQKIVTCHLGNGASIAAVKAGRSVDCSLGFTPLEGLMMGTRCGDLDAAIPLHLIREMGMDADEVDALLNRRSGLLGVSGVSSDMRDVIQAAREGAPRAQLALGIFCYRVRKYIGAYAAAMGGVNAVVFTAGIGENSPEIRRKCVRGLEFLDLHLDEDRNQSISANGSVAVISIDDSPSYLLVIPTDEELMIARDTARVVRKLGT